MYRLCVLIVVFFCISTSYSVTRVKVDAILVIKCGKPVVLVGHNKSGNISIVNVPPNVSGDILYRLMKSRRVAKHRIKCDPIKGFQI